MKSATTLLDLFGLQGKTALVTGGAVGVGRMIAVGLAAAGARVLIASRKGDACRAVADEEINQAEPGVHVEGFAGAIGSEKEIRALVGEVHTRTERLDILVNNAGATWGSPIAEFPFAAWEKVLKVNVAGSFTLTRELLLFCSAAELRRRRRAS